MIWRFGGFEIDDRRRLVQRGGRSLPLEPQAFSLLLELLRAHPQPLSREILLERIWPHAVVTTSSLSRAAYVLRNALAANGGDRDLVRTLHGFGYALGRAPERHSTERGEPVGRGGPLRVLREALAGVREGVGGVVAVAGEPGIGKTHLIEHFARTVEPPAVVLSGRAIEGDAPPYWEWRPVVTRCASALSRQRLGALARGRVGSLLAVAPGLAPSLEGAGEEDPPAHPAQLWHDVAHFLVGAGEEHPLVIVLEDLHWAGPDSLHLLRYLAHEVVAEAHVLLVASFRDRGAPENPALDASVAHLATLPHVRPVVRLEPFSPAEIEAYLDRESLVLGQPDLVDELARWTGGNPLFLREVVELIREGHDVRARRVPVSLAAAVREHVRRLAASTRQLLEVASIFSGETEVEVLARTSGCSREEAIERLGEAQRAGLVEMSEPHHFRFTHELVRDALREVLSRDRAAELHRRAADALETIHAAWLEPWRAELSFHLFEALPLVPGERVARHARAAARQARQRAAFTEAVRHLERALRSMTTSSEDEAVDRCDVLLELADAATLSGDGERAMQAILEAMAIARSRRDGVRLARAALAHTAWSVPILADGPAIAALEEALVALQEGDVALRLRLLTQLAVQRHFAGDHEEGARLRSLVLARSEQIEDPQLRATLRIAHLAAVQQGACHEPPGERLELATRACSSAQEASLPDLAVLAQRQRISILDEIGDAPGLQAEVDAFGAAGDTVPLRVRRYYAVAFRAARRLVRCEFDAARVDIARLLRLADPRDPSECLFTPTTQRLLLPLARDEAEELLETIQHILARFPGARGWRAAPPLVYQQLGWREAAQRHLDEALEHGLQRFLLHNMTDLTVLATTTEACHWVGERRHARELHDALAVYAGRNVDVGWGIACYGPVDYYRGLAAHLLGRRDEALAHFEAASAMNRRMELRLWEVRNRLARARTLAEGGDPGDAARAIALARATLDDARASGLRRESEELGGILRRLEPAPREGD